MLALEPLNRNSGLARDRSYHLARSWCLGAPARVSVPCPKVATRNTSGFVRLRLREGEATGRTCVGEVMSPPPRALVMRRGPHTPTPTTNRCPSQVRQPEKGAAMARHGTVAVRCPFHNDLGSKP